MAAMERATRTLSAQNLVISQAIAERLGINASDLECLDIAREMADEVAVTAGQLADWIGLTSGAITGVIDRLERAGLVKRQRDPKDRRKVMVRPTSGASKTVPPLFQPLHDAMCGMWERYSDAQLELILDFLTNVRDVMVEEVGALRGRAPAAAEKPRKRA